MNRETEQKNVWKELLEMVLYLVIALVAALLIVKFVGQRTQWTVLP